MDTAAHQTVLYSFTFGADGANPAGVIRDSAGNLYGTTFRGAAGAGVQPHAGRDAAFPGVRHRHPQHRPVPGREPELQRDDLRRHRHELRDVRADQIAEALARPVRIDDHDVDVAASIGIALLTEQQSAGELLQAADLALYAAKAAGKARWTAFECELNESLIRVYHLQPRMARVDSTTGTTTFMLCWYSS